MLQADVYADFYLKPLLIALALEVLPDTPEIALLSCSSLFQPGRKLITAAAMLHASPELDTIW